MKLHLLLIAIIFQASRLVDCFLLPYPSTVSIGKTGNEYSLKARNPEFSVVDDDNDNDNVNDSRSSDFRAISDFTVVDEDEADEEEEEESLSEEEEESLELSSKSTKAKSSRYEYAALLHSDQVNTNTVLQIQVGDMALARKAWKKRRRTGSPMLVPCSVLHLDRKSMLRWNLMYLLYKFGSSEKNGVVMSLVDLAKRYKSHLKSQLNSHATALGYETASDLIQGLFDDKTIQDTFGVRLITDTNKDDKNQVYLKSTISKYRAKQMASKAILLQVTKDNGGTDTPEKDTMKHTGYIRSKSDGQTPGKFYEYSPLSAAIRVSQREDIETGKIQQGSIQSAMLFDFDEQGDGGLPLLTLTLNPTRRSNVHRKYTVIRKPRYLIEDLKVGGGPYEATVVRLAKDHAVVDFGVCRTVAGTAHADEAVGVGTPEYVKVQGVLRFKDAVSPDSIAVDDQLSSQKSESGEDDGAFASMRALLDKVEKDFDKLDDGEEAEDITNLFSMNADGSLSYQNPETGENEIVSTADESDNSKAPVEEASLEEDDKPTTFAMPSRPRRSRRSIRLHVGDLVPVHILSVSKQSNQFTVTTNPSAVRGKTAKDIKKEGDVSKKLERLSQMLGGLEKAEEMRGREYDGTVKATSQTGDWLYVQPNGNSEGGIRLPVGVATLQEELASEYESSSFAQGDLVRIQMDGIDESRGQLAMRITKKLSP